MIAPPSVLPRLSPFSAATTEARSGSAKATVTWTSLPGGVIDGGEIVVLAIKPSIWRIIFDSAPWIVTSVFLAIALTVLRKPLPGLSIVATAEVMLLIGAVRVAFGFIRWVPTWYVLTNRRIIDVQGVRKPRIASHPLVAIRNTYVHNSPTEKLVGLGTITFVIDDAEDQPRIWQSVAKPDMVHTKIRRAIESAMDQFGA